MIHLTFQSLSTSLGFAFARFAQIGIKPAAEPVLLVPVALPVANQHQFVGSHGRLEVNVWSLIEINSIMKLFQKRMLIEKTLCQCGGRFALHNCQTGKSAFIPLIGYLPTSGCLQPIISRKSLRRYLLNQWQQWALTARKG